MDSIGIMAASTATAAQVSAASAPRTYSSDAFRSNLTSAMADKTGEASRARAKQRDDGNGDVTVYSASTTTRDELAQPKTEETTDAAVTTQVTSDQSDSSDEAQAVVAASVLTNDWGLRVNDILNSPENLENAYQRVSENLALGSMLSGINGFNFMADQFGITPDELFKISNELFAKAKAELIATGGGSSSLGLEGGASFTIKAAADGPTTTADPLAVASNDAEQTASAGANALLQSDNISDNKSGSDASQTGTNSFANSILAAFKADTTLELPVSVAELEQGAQLSNEASQSIVESMLDNVQSAVSAQKSTLRVQLKPEVLGGIEIELTMTSEGINAQMRTNNQQVQALLNTELTQLMDSLRQRGVQINQLDVVYSQLASGDMMFEQGDGRNDGAWADNKAALAAARATKRAAEPLDMGYATGAYEDLSTYDAQEQENVPGVVYDA